MTVVASISPRPLIGSSPKDFVPKIEAIDQLSDFMKMNCAVLEITFSQVNLKFDATGQIVKGKIIAGVDSCYHIYVGTVSNKPECGIEFLAKSIIVHGMYSSAEISHSLLNKEALVQAFSQKIRSSL